MTAKEFPNDTTIIQVGEPVEYISLISKGSVLLTLPSGEMTLKIGDAIGVHDICQGQHACSYTTLEDTTLLQYPCSNPEDLLALLRENSELSVLYINSMTRQICEVMDMYVLSSFFADNLYRYLHDSYLDYKDMCQKLSQPVNVMDKLEQLNPLVPPDAIQEWESKYYESFRSLDNQTKNLIFQNNPTIGCGYLCKISEDLHKIYHASETISAYTTNLSSLLLNSQKLDLFGLLTDLYIVASKSPSEYLALDATISRLSIQLEGNPNIDIAYYNKRMNEYKEKMSATKVNIAATAALMEDKTDSLQKSAALSSLSGSLDMILNYSGCAPETAERFRENIIAWKHLADKNSDDEKARKLRLEITKLFNEIYINVFEISCVDQNLPAVIKMFLNFGYMDEVLAGFEQSCYLYSIIQDYHGDAAKGVYTFYEWLMMIYHGEKEPSRNEFDVDYTAYIHEMKVSGQITAELEQRLLKDNVQKCLYELHNMFPVVNKVTFGRISTFCPVLCDQNLLKTPEYCLVTPDKISECIDHIREVDYNVFYKETIYSNPSISINKEMVHTEVLPDIILTPNVGNRGIMWQEIEGKKRSTPARFILPALCLVDLDVLFMRLTAEYRWEMCKRIQGSRWNDVSDPSLTSLYCDYAQFYKKNNDLSTQAKEQVKANLLKAKNNFREMFVRDYLVWILYESSGSPRLNKVVRGILFDFCPFSLTIRNQLSTNPLFSDAIVRYDRRQAQAKNRLELLFKKLTSASLQIPSELSRERNYLEK